MRKLTIDYLAGVDDTELDRHFKRMHGIIRSTRGGQKESAEIELCYVQRELDIRRKRHQMHREYIDEIAKKRSNFQKRYA